ncbi:MAG: universal stress protein [Longimicrobiales bacterium]
MYHTILVPLDGSMLAEWALPVAISIARRSGASLELITVEIVLPTLGAVGGLSTETSDATTQDAPLAYLRNVAQRVAAIYRGPVKHTVKSGHGRGATSLLRHSKDVGADLIVMATHGYGPLKRFWLGSVADTVARRSRIPTLLIRPRSEEPADLAFEPRFHNVLVPLDGSSAAEAILEHSMALGESGVSKYTLLQAVSPVVGLGPDYIPIPGPVDLAVLRARRDLATQYLEKVAARLHARAIEVEIAIDLETFAAAAILEYAETHPTDLITLTTHGHGGALRLVLGSVADKIVRGAMVPVLLHRPRAC